MNHINKLKLSPDLIHLIECLFQYENSEKKSVTKEVCSILDCSIAYTTSLRKEWKKNNGSIINYQKKLKVTEEQAIAKLNKTKHFTSAKECKTCGNNVRYTSNRACIVCCTLPAHEKEAHKEAALKRKKHQISKLQKLNALNETKKKQKSNLPPLPIIQRENRVVFKNTFSTELEGCFNNAKELQRSFENIFENKELTDKAEQVAALLEVPLTKANRIIKQRATAGKKYLIPKIHELLKAEQELASFYRLKVYESHIPCRKCTSRLRYPSNRGCKPCLQKKKKIIPKDSLLTSVHKTDVKHPGQLQITRHA